MTINHDTFIDDMLIRCRLKNILDNHASRYPVISESEMKELAPDYVFLSSEPFPFKATHVEKLKQLLPSSRICLVNGEYFSWYGSRLIMAPAYFNGLLNTL